MGQIQAIAVSGASVDAGSGNAWSNPDRITAEDGSAATSSTPTHWLEGVFSLASALADAGTIDGITVAAKLRSSTITINPAATLEVWSGSAWVTHGSTALSASITTTHGWKTWSAVTALADPAILRASGWRVRFRLGGGFSGVHCDALRVTVDYSPPAGVRLGAQGVQAIYLGGTPLQAIQLGGVQLWP